MREPYPSATMRIGIESFHFKHCRKYVTVPIGRPRAFNDVMRHPRPSLLPKLSERSRLVPLPISCLRVVRSHAKHASRVASIPRPRLDPPFRRRQYFLAVCVSDVSVAVRQDFSGERDEALSLVAAKRCFVVDQDQGRKKCHFRRCTKVHIRPAVRTAEGRNEDSVGPCRR